MTIQRTALLVAAVLVVVATAGCFGPGEDQVTTEAQTGTTAAETVEAGADPTAAPNQTPTVFGTTTGRATANATETTANATD